MAEVPDAGLEQTGGKPGDGHDTRPTYRLLLPDSVRGMVTYIIVLAGIGSFMYATFWAGDETATDSVIAFFGTLLGTVLGFFFGARGTDKALRAASVAEEAKREATKVALGVKEQALAEVKRSTEYEEFLQRVASRNDPGLVQKVEDILQEIEEMTQEDEDP